ncbi:MAG TPA: Gfo/Idh/MocA family oxidoreductase [Opitutus sp.]|nr:Gfo/Idh/MocA family oxidoreductase [Opitutus sp.]
MTAASHPLPRIALIGLSGYGRIHLQLARECRDRGEAEIVAATVINPEEEAANIAELKAHGCAIHADYAEMLRGHAGQIELCMIPTGIHWHARMTIAALRAGANVLVEKPLAGSTADVAAVRAAERESGRFVAVGFQDLYEPGTLWLKQQLLAGAIGGLRSVRFLGVWPRNRGYFTRNDWAGRGEVDGVAVLDSPLNNAFGHFVMLSLFFASADERAAAEMKLDRVELFRAHDIPTFDTAVVTGRTPRGVRLWFGVSHAAREPVEPEIIVDGAEGTAGWRYEREAWLRDASGREARRAMPDMTATRRSMMAAVLRRLHGAAAPMCGTELAARHTAVIEAVHRAAPVRDFARDQIDWGGLDGAPTAVPEVAGLTPALRRAFAAEQARAACGVPAGGAGAAR